MRSSTQIEKANAEVLRSMAGPMTRRETGGFDAGLFGRETALTPRPTLG